jgi:hypothetical protein
MSLSCDVELSRSFLKSIIALKCLSYSQGQVLMVVDDACIAINEDGVSCEVLIGILFAESNVKAPG